MHTVLLINLSPIIFLSFFFRHLKIFPGEKSQPEQKKKSLENNKIPIKNINLHLSQAFIKCRPANGRTDRQAEMLAGHNIRCCIQFLYHIHGTII